MTQQSLTGYGHYELGFAILVFALVYFVYQQVCAESNLTDWMFTVVFFGIAYYILKMVFQWLNDHDIANSYFVSDSR
jgi:hypothetical protein